VQTIRLEDNNIKQLGNRQFSPFHHAHAIDLSNNQISSINKNAFYGLTNLKRLLLYENRIKSVEVGTFSRLSNLEILFLNSNQVRCIQKDLFNDLTQLKILSLYDNQLDTLPKGLFETNNELRTIHLAQNEWNCDCKLRWLIEYFRDYHDAYLAEHDESKYLEESGATCSKYSSSLLGNKNRDSGIILTELNPVLMKCKGERILSVCEDICPDQCICDQKTRTVNCRNVGINIVPDKLPVYTEVLDLSGNQIKEIPGFLAKFPIVELDLSQNHKNV